MPISTWIASVSAYPAEEYSRLPSLAETILDRLRTVQAVYLVVKPILSDVADLYLAYRSIVLAHNYTKRRRGNDVGIAKRQEEEASQPRKWKSASRSISWSSGPSDSLRACIGSITDSGNAVLFARTPDGGALVFKVYAGNVQTKEYVTEVGDIASLLAWAVEQYG